MGGWPTFNLIRSYRWPSSTRLRMSHQTTASSKHTVETTQPPAQTTHQKVAIPNIFGSVAFRVESLLPEPDVGGTLPGWKLSSHKHWV